MIKRETNHKGKDKTLEYIFQPIFFINVNKCEKLTLINKSFFHFFLFSQLKALPLHSDLKQIVLTNLTDNMIQVTFYKKVDHIFGEPTMQKVEFTHNGDKYEDAFDEALKLGHNPFKNIRMKYVPTNS